MERQQVYEKMARMFLVAFVVMMCCLVMVYAHSEEAKDAWEFISYVCPCAAGVFAGAGLYFRGRPEAVVTHSAPAPEPGPAPASENTDDMRSVLDGAALIEPVATDDEQGREPNPPSDPSAPTSRERKSIRELWDRLIRWSPSERVFYVVSVLLLFAGLVGYVFGHTECRKPAMMIGGVFLSSSALVAYTQSLSGDRSNSTFLLGGSIFWGASVIVIPIILMAALLYFPGLFDSFNGVSTCGR